MGKNNHQHGVHFHSKKPQSMTKSDRTMIRVASGLGSAMTESLHEQKESAAFRGQRLSAVPSDLLTLHNVVRVDMSTNQLTRFPGALVASELPRVEVLLLQDNLLFVFEDVLALSRAPRLRELDVRRNPLRLQNNRVYLLEALFNASGCDDELLLMDFHDTALKHADEGVSRAGGTSMKYRSKLPRRHGFPMLLKLNDEWVTDREVKEVEAERGAPIQYFRPSKQQRMDEGEDYKRQRSSKTTEGADTKTKLMMMMMMSTKPNGAEKQGKPPDRHFDGSRMTMRQIVRGRVLS
jgi:Leucine-rich repeat (LRR) protein